MTPTDFHLLPSRELTTQPYSKVEEAKKAEKEKDKPKKAPARPALKVSRHTQVNI